MLPVCTRHKAISIHTPHAGSDACKDRRAERDKRFQSTLPMRGATLFQLLHGGVRLISIHTPHAGSDSTT